MAKKADFVSGVVAFSNLTAPDVYKGKSTGRYSITITMDEQNAEKLRSQNVVLKDYEGKAQRKFATQFNFVVEDAHGIPFVGEIPYGSSVRVLYTTSPSEEHGMVPHLLRVKVLELADSLEVPEDF
jgi:hypothetical protein